MLPHSTKDTCFSSSVAYKKAKECTIDMLRPVITVLLDQAASPKRKILLLLHQFHLVEPLRWSMTSGERLELIARA